MMVSQPRCMCRRGLHELQANNSWDITQLCCLQTQQACLGSILVHPRKHAAACIASAGPIGEQPGEN
jgi:hypothetical protein